MGGWPLWTPLTAYYSELQSACLVSMCDCVCVSVASFPRHSFFSSSPLSCIFLLTRLPFFLVLRTRSYLFTLRLLFPDTASVVFSALCGSALETLRV